VDCRIGLDQMIKEQFQVNCVITSPPYFGLRDYEIPLSIWDGDPNCDHDFDIKNHKNPLDRKGTENKQKYKARSKQYEEGFCSKCGAWLGALGSESNITLYIKHLCDIYDLVWQVLKKSGTNWVNLGDTYSSGGRSGSKEYFERGHKQFGKNDPQGRYQLPKKVEGFPSKCLLMIPQRFAIEMVNRGWILRNTIIWNKSNSMPESCKDRFTNNFEYIFFFVKNIKPIYWVNNKTGKLVEKKPLGIHGIEYIDWEWRKCNKCLGTGIKHTKCKACEGEGWVYNIYLQPQKCDSCKGKGRIEQDKECKSCKGKGKKKRTYWKSRDYYFEQQFEISNTEFIYSRNSNKGGVQAKNNPYANWGFTRKELELYNSKYKENEYGQTLQGFIRNQSIKKERESSRIKAPLLFPNNKKKQQEYINYIHDHGLTSHIGRNKRCVWEIPTKPNPESHFAVFNSELIETPIKAGCPEFVCETCGKPREKIIDNSTRINTRSGKNVGNAKSGTKSDPNKTLHTSDLSKYRQKIISKTIGYSDCNHNSKWKPGIVLDPFAGIGTTLLTAWNLGRNYIGFEMSKKYCEIAEKYLSKTRFKRLDDFMYPEHRKIEV